MRTSCLNSSCRRFCCSGVPLAPAGADGGGRHAAEVHVGMMVLSTSADLVHVARLDGLVFAQRSSSTESPDRRLIRGIRRLVGRQRGQGTAQWPQRRPTGGGRMEQGRRFIMNFCVAPRCAAWLVIEIVEAMAHACVARLRMLQLQPRLSAFANHSC